MWSSVLFYKTPSVEVMACVLLSTKAIYFLLDDSFVHADEHQSGKITILILHKVTNLIPACFFVFSLPVLVSTLNSDLVVACSGTV